MTDPDAGGDPVGGDAVGGDVGGGDDAAALVHRAQAIAANTATWDLLGRDDLCAEQQEDLVQRVYASAYHWARAAGRGPQNAPRAEYLIAMVQLKIGRPELGLHHAERCAALTAAAGLTDFDLAYAHEVRARALKAVGRTAEAEAEWSAALAVPVADPEDRQIVEQDFAVPL